VSAVVTIVFGVLASSAFAGSGTSATDQYAPTQPVQPAVVKPVVKSVVKSVVKPVVKPVKPAVVASAAAPGASNAASTVSNAKPVSNTAVKAAAPKKGALPFTGFSLVGTVLTGAGLVGVGIVLRRRNAKDED
jgi:hypothetical protein